ncbi:MAG: UDP-N-acetylmuramoyl-L-alanyl-D-glutamate--2,6-diaminopimelate ligase [candidate division WOR-3 bacterium]|nr:UDP-N-acetylmuramoyl-L-alanyl-D-glutamate--2,6-diaminopimelate ligase [candidate division WOR-3 bacterium]MDW8149902.1 UDP-N-acetylmuramoyl-L-alanyl-D-glutamate--2,6-diaminopimelate ligase [candidate division WOR-3 bacterium]
MKLSELFKGYNIENFQDFEVEGIAYDSREVKNNFVFFAISGEKFDGHSFIEDAIKNGAKAIVVEKRLNKHVNQILVDNTRLELSRISAKFYNYSSEKLFVIGITGTNGKTTTTHIIYQALNMLGYKSGIIGTIINDLVIRKEIPKLTTPESLDLQRYIFEILNSGGKFLVMEVSSHALSLHRVDDVDFKIAGFTNLAIDHLDFHKTFENYREAKLKLFKMLKKENYGVINIDDENSGYFINACNGKVLTYGFYKNADIKGEILENSKDGLKIKVLNKTIENNNMIGEFNAYNLLCAYSILNIIGFDSDKIVDVLSKVKPPKGRLQKIKNVFIDYAHTPDAIEKVIRTLKKVYSRKIILVFGAGGNRDRSKRPLMGKVSELSDIIIITSDNPRDEEPMDIVNDIQNGMKRPHIVELDRKKAIELAIKIANSDDIVLIAGKGHETYQEIKGIKYHFDDEEIVRSII